VRDGSAHRARLHGSPGATSAGHRARDGRDGGRGRDRRDGPAAGDKVVVRPLDRRGETAAVNLFDVFWKELEVLGTRVYEPEDYDTAIGLIVGGHLSLADLITSVEPLERLPAALEQLERNPSAMKILVDCRA
jgi:hypothetical protein